MYWSEVCECGGVLGGSDKCDSCESGFELALVISVGIRTVEDGVAIYHEGGWSVDVGFCESHDVDVVLFHVPDDGVYFGCLCEACGVPASKSCEVLAWDFGGLFVPVVVWGL